MKKLIAIITNNFSLCNGRWPTQILIATLFIGALVPKQWSDTVAMLAVIGIAVLGIVFSFFTSWLLSKTLLKGESSFFVLELPPYRPPRFFQTLYTSLIDRTLIVLWRAVVFAAPAGAVIWLICNLQIAHQPICSLAHSRVKPHRRVYRLKWRNPACLYRCHSSQRNRHSHRADAHHYGLRANSSRRGGRRTNGSLNLSSRYLATRWGLDAPHRREPNALQLVT